MAGCPSLRDVGVQVHVDTYNSIIEDSISESVLLQFEALGVPSAGAGGRDSVMLQLWFPDPPASSAVVTIPWDPSAKREGSGSTRWDYRTGKTTATFDWEDREFPEDEGPISYGGRDVLSFAAELTCDGAVSWRAQGVVIEGTRHKTPEDLCEKAVKGLVGKLQTDGLLPHADP